MLTNGEENVEGLIKEAEKKKEEESSSPREIVVGPGEN